MLVCVRVLIASLERWRTVTSNETMPGFSAEWFVWILSKVMC